MTGESSLFIVLSECLVSDQGVTHCNVEEVGSLLETKQHAFRSAFVDFILYINA